MNKTIESVLTEQRRFEIPPSKRLKPHLASFEEYQKQYQVSVENPEKFWGEIAQEFTWYQKWDRVLQSQWNDKIENAWFEGAKTNLSLNCLDRHLEKHGEALALIWEGNEPGEIRKFTYTQLHQEVCRLSNALKSLGVKRGDRVALYMGMVPELAMSLLACARIGAIHNVVFGGFSAKSLQERVLDCHAEFVITVDGLFRGSKTIALKANVDEALQACSESGHEVKACLVLKRTEQKISMQAGRDHWWHEVVPAQSTVCEPEVMNAEDPLFILYTSGSTGKPKGVLHTTAGYMVYAATSFKYVFAYQPGDIYWCTADIGWVTGHSYLVYGPLLNGATTFMFEGVPTYPQADRFWDMIERHQVNIFYTAPTALRALMRESDELVTRHDLSSLKVLGTVGEPINPEAWLWYFKTVGQERCPIVDTWWQTETGGILLTTIPGIMPMKPGATGLPFFGVKPQILREDGSPCEVHEGGYLVMKQSWPAIMRGVYGQAERLKQTYFSKFPGYYLTGDGAQQDEDGYFWVMGRLDDVLNVSGHRLGTAELESALVQHPKVVEAAVVGFPHEIKGDGIYAFVTLKEGLVGSTELKNELIQHLSKVIGPIAKPDRIQFADSLPKTRSGKIMRRILRKIAAGDTHDLGDTSTLADSGVVEKLVGEAGGET